MFPTTRWSRRSRRQSSTLEYLMLRHKEGKLRTTSSRRWARWPTRSPATFGSESRAQDQGGPGAHPRHEVTAIERCSGHDGTYAVKREFFDAAMKIGRPWSTRSSS